MTENKTTGDSEPGFVAEEAGGVRKIFKDSTKTYFKDYLKIYAVALAGGLAGVLADAGLKKLTGVLLAKPEEAMIAGGAVSLGAYAFHKNRAPLARIVALGGDEENSGPRENLSQVLKKEFQGVAGGAVAAGILIVSHNVAASFSDVSFLSEHIFPGVAAVAATTWPLIRPYYTGAIRYLGEP